MDDPMRLGEHARIPLSEITIRASRSSGPGGQHANVTASRVEAIFDADASTSLTDGQRQLIRSRLGPRVVAVAQDARSQSQNRELALNRLRDRLQSALHVDPPRTPTRPTRASEERRAAAKRTQSQRKRLRRSPADDEG